MQVRCVGLDARVQSVGVTERGPWPSLAHAFVAYVLTTRADASLTCQLELLLRQKLS